MIGVRAHPHADGTDSVERVVGPGKLLDILAGVDVVVCSAMASAQTRHVFDSAAFAACKPEAVFINVACGVMADDDAVLAALEPGQISW